MPPQQQGGIGFFGSSKVSDQAMDLYQPGPEKGKSQTDARHRLPNRRPNETISFERDGSCYRMTIGFFPDGRPGELFLNHDRDDSLLDVLAHDAAILASIAIQYGATIGELRHALKRDVRGVAASPIGAALDRIAP
jgi:hypothetical protein